MVPAASKGIEMKNSKQIREEIAALGARVVAITNVAKEEGRELSADELKDVESITNEQVPTLQKQLETAEKVEAFTKQFVRNKQEKKAKEESSRIRIPARARNTCKLHAFKSEEDAYACGQFIIAHIGDSSSGVTKNARRFCRENGIRNAMTTSDNTKGGALVPEPLENAIVELRERYGVFRQYANVMTMTDGVTLVPKLTGEVTGYFVGETPSATTPGDEITPSDVTVQQVRLEAKRLAAMTLVSSELNEDSVISVAEMVARSVAQTFAIKEDECGFLGDGTSTYGGIVGLAGALAAGSKVTATSRQTFSALTFGDFESVVGAAKNWAGYSPAWFISKAGWAASMQRLLNGVGGATMAEVSGGPSMMFLGYPVVFTEVLEKRLTGTTGLPACYFGDLRIGAYMGSRRGVNIRADESRYFEQDAIAIRATERFDINVHDRGTASVSGGLIQLVFG